MLYVLLVIHRVTEIVPKVNVETLQFSQQQLEAPGQGGVQWGVYSYIWADLANPSGPVGVLSLGNNNGNSYMWSLQPQPFKIICQAVFPSISLNWGGIVYNGSMYAQSTYAIELSTLPFSISLCIGLEAL